MTREEAIKILNTALFFGKCECPKEEIEECLKMAIKALEQEPQTFKWCETCKEYDQEKHCCHRWSKVIRDTVEEMKQEQESRWIPVSEKLPEKNVWVLVTVEQNGNRYQEIMRRTNYIESWTDDIDFYTDEITAWMTLPEPYKTQESEG